MSGNDGAVSYSWSINGSVYATSESITVPAYAEEGDAITVTVTDADGNIASDTVYVVADLALIAVESADLGTNTYLIAYFSEPVGDLKPADIEIRRVSDNKLVTVESVDMSSDGLTAHIALVGASVAGGGAALVDNTDYRMIVTSNGQTAEKVFSIPGVADEEVVTAIDPSKRTITTASGTYADENEFISDFQEVLGRTVTAEFDKNHIITSFVMLDEPVIYTAITAKDANSDAGTIIDTIVDTDKNEYTLVSATPGTSGKEQAVGSIYATTEIVLDGNASVFATNTAIAATKQTAKYAKIVLNGNGSVRSLVTIYNWDKSVYVADVTETYVVDYAGAYTNLKDFTILKDGETITIDDIEEGDVVFVSTDNNKKVAEVYSENVVSGELTVYTGKADIGTKRYDLGGGWAVIGDKVVTDTTANLKDISGSDVVAYLDRANKLAQTIVDSETAANSSEFVVITENAKNYTEGKEYKVSFKAGNGEAISEYEITVSDLTSLVTNTGTQQKYDKTNATPNGAAITNLTNGTFGINGTAGITTNTDLVQGKLVKIIKNSEGTIIGLELATKGYSDYDFYSTPSDRDMKSTQTTNDTFEGKMTSLNKTTPPDALIEGSTPVYVYNKTNKTVVKYAYSDVDFTATAAATGQINARYSSDGKSIVAFYIDETKTNLAEAAVAETKRAVVADKPVLDKDGTNFAELKVYEGLETVKYKTFAQDVAAITLAKGDFVDVALTEDGEVYGITKIASNAAALGEFVVETNHVDSNYILNTESGVETTIVIKDATGSYSAKTWSELGSVVANATSISVAKYGNSASYVDAIYVELAGALAGASNTVTFPAFTSNPGTSAASGATVVFTATAPGTGLTFKLQSSADGVAWTDVANGDLTPATATTGTQALNTSATAVDIKAGTYYRIEIDETGSAPRWVSMTGEKTAASVLETATFTKATATLTGANTFTVTGINDQFGDAVTTVAAKTYTMTKQAGGSQTATSVTLSIATTGAATVTIEGTETANECWECALTGGKTATFTADGTAPTLVIA